MKKILLALLFIPSIAFAGPEAIENDLISNPKTGTYILGRQNEAQTSISATAGDAIAPSFDRYGNQMCSLQAGTASATNPVKLEDSAHTSGDAGLPVFAIRNDALNTLTNADGDYSGFAVGPKGNLFASLYYESAIGSGGPVRLEDAAIADSAPSMMVGFQAQDPLTVDQNASGDAAFGKLDRAGRLITTLAPAGESWQSCSSSNTGTSDTVIKAAVASNRIYTTSISCFNTAAVASSIAFKDGATQIYVGAVSNSTLQGVAYFQHTLPVPLRGSVNTALNFAMGTTATATTCCAAGYISVN